ncbi:peptide chain release factor N(5)-glutamine methyltransferase [Candidatus Dojkabacteria bacterium]|nr:peptide chain release factor N(5)-glutamine methyltransferase [Candidatus Dojkabacteria bacterium]
METINNLAKALPKDQIDDIYQIISKVTGKTKTFILSNPDFQLSSKQNERLSSLIERYNNNEPLAYILGYKHFYDSRFRVNKYTLIPRPETEVLVEKVLESIGTSALGLLDTLEIGTGSGCISISIANTIAQKNETFPKARILATDISEKALKTARVNAKMILDPQTRSIIDFRVADVVTSDTRYPFDIVISNPPYIPEHEYKNLDPSVKDYEPRNALEAGIDGLDIYRKILERTKSLVKPTTVFFFEINPGTITSLKTLIKGYYPKSNPKTLKDQYDTKRFLCFRTRERTNPSKKN